MLNLSFPGVSKSIRGSGGGGGVVEEWWWRVVVEVEWSWSDLGVVVEGRGGGGCKWIHEMKHNKKSIWKFCISRVTLKEQQDYFKAISIAPQICLKVKNWSPRKLNKSEKKNILPPL